MCFKGSIVNSIHDKWFNFGSLVQLSNYLMVAPRSHFKTIDEYIAACPKDAQTVLEKVRQLVHELVPEAIETISYQIPCFKLNGKFVAYFAGWKDRIAFYPMPQSPAALVKELSPYLRNKRTISFPFSKPIPYDLVKKIVMNRLREVRK